MMTMFKCRYWPFCSWFKSHGCIGRRCEHYRVYDRAELMMVANEIEEASRNPDTIDADRLIEWANGIREAIST